MRHEEKVACFEQLLKNRGFWMSNAIPPACRLLWRLGFKTPPPYFLSFPVGALSAGLPFGLLWTAFMWVTIWHDELSLPAAVVSITLTGTVFGVAMAAYWRWQSRKLQLPTWNRFPDALAPTA